MTHHLTPSDPPTEAARAARDDQPFLGEDALEVLGAGMKPLPDDTDMDILVAAYDLIGRAGASDFEVGYDTDQPADRWWFAQCTYGDTGAHRAQWYTSAHDAAERLARRIVNGGRCTHCGKVSSLQGARGDQRPPGQPGVCFWTRTGKRWERGCVDTHADRSATRDAINDFIERTGSPARKET